MDAIQLLMALFLNLSEPCNALQATVQQIGGQDYQVLRYTCGQKNFRVWQSWCPDGQGYWSRPFMLVEDLSQQGIYMNRFGELVTGYHITMNEVYIPHCGT